MDSIFSAQADFVAERSLVRVPVVRNDKYKHHGRKSYVYLMSRFGFQATKPGPFFQASKLEQRGLRSSGHARGGPARFTRVLKKGPSAAGGDQSGKAGEVTAEDTQNDAMWLCPVSIGTPPQKLMLDFDTGSSDLWVFSTHLSKRLQANHNVFDPKKSSSFVDSKGASWQIQYGDGSTASGVVGTDSVNVGGLIIKTQAVELAKQLAAQFQQNGGDGLLGLAWGSINEVKPTPVHTPVENMIRQGDVPKAAQLFTSAFYGYKDASAKDSFYTFGWIDQDLVKASGRDIAWTDVDNSQGFWAFRSEKTTVNGKAVTQDGNTAIADTGTTLALLSDDVCEAVYTAIEGARYDEENQGWLIPETVTADDLPEVQVSVGDNLFTIQKQDLAFADAGNGMWYGGIQSRGTMEFDILGDAFLKSIYAIWDQGNQRFGAVPKLEQTQNLTPPPQQQEWAPRGADSSVCPSCSVC